MSYLSDEDFFYIYSKVPRLGIDLIIQSEEGVLLALRSIEPNNGLWHTPGGTVYKGETIAEAAVRIAKKETGLQVKVDRCLGYMDFPGEMRSGVDIHTVSIAMKVIPLDNNLVHDENAKELRYFKELPENTIVQHREFLKKQALTQ